MPEDLRRIRKRKGLSVKDLAGRTGISVAVLKEYESGARALTSQDRRKVARALYVGEWEINIRSSPPPPRPKPPPAEKKPRRPPKKGKKKKREAAPRPARETQITHMLKLAECLGMNRQDVEAEVGKPLDQLTVQEARRLNYDLSNRVAGRKAQSPLKRRRSHLPEGIDEFEMRYLQEVQDAGNPLAITLFNGEKHEGTVVGFSPYTITIQEADGSEVTLNKLAIAYYRRAGGGA